MLRKLGQNNQVAVPREIVKRMGLKINDYIDIRIEGNSIILEPQVLIPKDQEYFYTEAWQADERKAAIDIKTGKVTKTKNIKELLGKLEA
ncbi:MAG: AbrB/MazE/SpoVT family DNA-binding domain-containing protein [Candidatus Omnitrophica bacterium]|nr:AbrB/MazE/SpoVT family DNA-binding domain-containing protein [Candidatus Omnitrophota bacterium]